MENQSIDQYSDNDSLIDGAHQQLVETICERMRLTDGYLAQGDDFIIYDMGNPEHDTHLRGATAGKDAQASELLEVLEKFDDDPRQEWSIRVHPHASGQFRNECQAAGYELQDANGYPIMTIEEPLHRNISHDVALIPQDDNGDKMVMEASPVLEQCFSLSATTAHRLLGNGTWTNNPNWRAAVAWYEGTPACFGMLTRSDDSDYAGIYYIATLKSFRGLGLAKDLVAVLTDEGFRLGARHVILQASDLGVPVYTRLGYREIARYHSLTQTKEN